MAPPHSLLASRERLLSGGQAREFVHKHATIESSSSARPQPPPPLTASQPRAVVEQREDARVVLQLHATEFDAQAAARLDIYLAAIAHERGLGGARQVGVVSVWQQPARSRSCASFQPASCRAASCQLQGGWLQGNTLRTWNPSMYWPSSSSK